MSGRRTNPGRKLGSTRRLRQNVHHPEVAEEEQEPHAKPEKDIPTEANSQGAANVKENAAALNTIQEIFHDCDTEAKGFITRADMQKLAADLPLTSEELEQVFQSLDREGNGFITNEDFSEGLRKFMETSSVMSEGRPKDEEASTHVDPGASVDINVRGFSTSQKRRKVGSSRRQPRTINPEGWLGTLAEETTDGSGIITHGDLQRLAGSLQLDFKDLQVVFDHLDHERHGFVTTEDFLKGLKQFLGKQPQLKDMQKKMEPSLYQSPVPDFLEEVDSEEKKHFLRLMESLGADNLLQDQTEIWKLWTELRYREPHLLENLEEFVAKVTLQIRQAQEEKESLELTLKKRIIDHNQEVQHLYEEMEHQIIQERERLRSERFKTSEAQAKHLRKALDQKNCEVHHLTKVQNELEESVQVLLNSKNKTSSENEELRRTNQELERQLEGIRGQLQQTKDRVQDMCSSMTRRQAGEAPEEHQPIQPLLGGSAVAQEPKECRRDNSKSSELLEEKESRRVPVVSKDEGPALNQHTNENTPTGSSQGRATQDTRLSQAQLLNSSGDDSLPDLIADSASSTVKREEKEKETRKKSKEEDEGQTVENLQAEEGEALQEEERARQQTWDTVAKGGQVREGDPTEDGQKGVGRKTEDDRNRWLKDKEGVGELLETEENKQGWEQEHSGKEINNDRKEQRWDVEEKLEDNSDIREEELEQDREETNGREDKHQTSEMEAELTEQGDGIHWAQKVDEVLVEEKNSNKQYSKQDKAHTEQEEGQTTAIVKGTAGSPQGSMQEKQDRCVDSEGKVLKQEYLEEDVWSKGNKQGGKRESIIHMSEAETVMEEKIYREEGEVKVINTDQEEASQNGDKTETVDDPAYTDSKQVNIGQGLISAEQEGLLVRGSVNHTQQDGFKGNVEELPKENEMSPNEIDEPNDRGQLLDSITEESSSKTKSDHLKEEHRMQGDKEPFKQKVQSEEENEETSNMLHSVVNEDQLLRKESIEENQEVPSSEVMEKKIKMHLEEGKQLKYNLKEELQATKEARQEEINATREEEHKDELKPAYISTTMSYEETTLRDVMQINVDLRNESTVVKRNDEFLETETEENIVEERDEDQPAQGKGQEKRVTFLLETEGKFRKNEDVTQIVVTQTTVHKDEAEVSCTQGGEQSQEEENVRYWVEGMYPVEQKGEIQVGETENLKAEERKLHSKDEGLEIDRAIHQNERGEGMESEETDNRRNIRLLGEEVVEHGNHAGGDEEQFDKKLCKLNNSISTVDVSVMDNTQQADQVGLMGLQSSTILVWEEWNTKNNLSNQEAFQDLTYNSGEQGHNRQLELNIPTAHIAQNEDGVMKILSDREQKDGVETNEDSLQKGDEEWKGDPFKDVETNITKDNLKEGNEQNKRTIHGEDGSGFLKEMEEISNDVYGVKDIQDNDECKNKAEMHDVRFGRNKDDKTELQEEQEEDTFRDGQGNAMENGEDRNDGLLQEGNMCKKRMDLQDDWKGILILDEEAIHHSTVCPTESKTDEEIKDGVNSSEAALGLDEEQQERKLGKLIINISDSNNYKKMKETNEDINNGEDSNGIKSSQGKNEKQEADLDKEIDTINKTDQEEEKWIKDGVVESNKKEESRLLEQLEEGTHEHVEINTKEEEINEKETHGLNMECKEEIQTVKKSDNHKENEESNEQDGICGYSTEKINSETDTREEESEEINEEATHGLKEEWKEEIQTIKKSENHEEHEETNEQVVICEYTSENINGLLKQEWEWQGSMFRIGQTNISNNEDHNSTECEDKLNSVKSEILVSNETNKTNFEDNEVPRKESNMESDIDLKWAELESDKLVKYNTHILTYDTPGKGGIDSSSHLWDQTEWEDTQGFKVYSKQEIKVLSGHDKIEEIFQVTMGRDDIAAEELEIQQEEAEKVVVCMEIPGMTEDTLDDQITGRIAADEQGEEAFWREDGYKKAEANRPENKKNGSIQMEKGFSKQPGDAVILLHQSTEIKLTKHKGDTAELEYALTDTPTYTDEEEGGSIVDYSITQVKGHQDEVSQLERVVSNIGKGYNGVMNKSEFLEEENNTEVNILPACILKNEKGIISGKKIYNEDQKQDPSSNTEKEGHTDDLENTSDSNKVCLGRMQLRDMPEETQMLAETICVPDGTRNKDTIVSEAINDIKEQTWDTKGQEVGVISEKLGKSSSSIYSNRGNNSGRAEGEVQLTQIGNFDLELQEKEEGYSDVNSMANYEETEGRGQNKENFNKMLPKEEKIQEKFQAKIVGLVETDEPRHVTKELDVLTLKCSPILIQVDDTLPDKLGMAQRICEFRDEVKEEEDQREGRGEDDHTMNSDSSLLGAGGKQPKLEEGDPIEKMLQVKLDTGHGMNEEKKEEAEQRETKGKHDQNMGYEFSKQGGESDGINLGTEINVDEMLPAELTKFTTNKVGEERWEHGEGGGKDERDMNSVLSLQGENSNDLSIDEGIQVEQMLHIKVDIRHEMNEVKKVEVEKLEGREASEKGISNNENLDQDSNSNNEKQVHKGDLEMTSDSEKVTLGEARKEEEEQSEAKGKYDHKLHYDNSIQGEETNETKHRKEINVDEALPAKRKETLVIYKEEEEWGEYREGTEMEEQDMNFGFSTQGETSNYLNIDEGIHGEKPSHVKLDNDLGMSEVKHVQMEQTEGRKKEKELKIGKCPLQEGDSSEAKVEDIHVNETLPAKWEMTLEMCDLYGKEAKQRQEEETDDRELRHGSSLQRSLLKEISADKTLPANLNVAEEICENEEKKGEDEWSEEKCNQQPHEGKSKEQNLEGETVLEKTLQVNVDIELEMNKLNQEEHEEARRKEDVDVNYESHLQEGDCEEIVLGKEIHVDETSTAIAKTVLTGSEVKEDEVEHKEERKSNERDMESGHFLQNGVGNDQNTDKGITMEERLQVSVNIELVESEAEQKGKTGEENEPNNGESSFQGGEGNKAKLGEDLYVIEILSDQKEGGRKHEQKLKYDSSLQAGAGSKVKCEEEEEVEELLQTKLDMAPVIAEVKEVGKSEETGKEKQKETIMYTRREQMQEESELPKLCRSIGLEASLTDDHKRETHKRGREESVHEKVVHDDEGKKTGFNAKEPEDHEENMQVKVKPQGNEGEMKSSVLEDENEVLHEVHDGEIFNKVRKEEGKFHETQKLQDQLLTQDEVVHKENNEPTAIKSFGIPEDCQETMVATREHHMGSNEMVEGDVQGFGWKMEITHELMEACEKGTGKNQKETVKFRDVQNKNRDEYCSVSREDSRDEILKHIGTENNTGEKMVPHMENQLENSDLKYGDINDTSKEDLMRVDDALEDSRIPFNEDLKNDAEHNPRSMEDSAGERDQTLEWEETKTQNEDFKWWEDIKNRSWEELLEAENPQKQKDKCNSQEETVQGEREGGKIYKYKIITYKNTKIQEERIEPKKQDVEDKVEKSRIVDQPSASSKGEYKKSERKNIHGLPFATAEWDRRADLKNAMSESKELDEQQRSEEEQGPQQQGATFNLRQEVEEAVLLHTRRTDEIVLLTDEKGGQPHWATEEKSSERITDPKEFKEVCQNEKKTIASSPNAEVPGRVKYPESERSTKRMKRSQQDEERQLSTGQKVPREGEDRSQPVKLNRDDVEELMANSGLSQKPDKLYNVVFIGESSVGKTSFIKKFCNGVFRLDLCATVGIDSCLRSLTVEGEQFVLQLWDTAGQERYHSITKQIFRKADGVVVMYDVTSSCTYVAVRYWLSCIEEGTDGDLPVLLLGNKTDITEKREVQVQEGGSLANEYGFDFMECSAASGYNVNESMASLARALKEKEDMMKENTNVVEVTPKKSSCC
ncbi:titin-like isoform X2 [Polypterus senegalus]|uniref:titin-like isoform X2 n=1 Tax=Polypterus senegalus TaxID=55291 RepID=UPI001966B7DA|nr:titin-like isoform X2 [Polypterus senegalus]